LVELLPELSRSRCRGLVRLSRHAALVSEDGKIAHFGRNAVFCVLTHAEIIY